MINEKQKEEIRIEAKKILDNFASALKDVKIKKERIKKDIGGYREEGSGEKTNSTFREQMFANAPNIDGDCIIAEKKKW